MFDLMILVKPMALHFVLVRYIYVHTYLLMLLHGSPLLSARRYALAFTGAFMDIPLVDLSKHLTTFIAPKWVLVKMASNMILHLRVSHETFAT